MMTDLSPRGSPTCHFREDLVKAEKHFILFNVHCHCHSVFVSSSQFVPISINNAARTLYVAVTMQMIIIILSNIVNIFNHLEVCPYADSVARPAIRTERSPPRRPCEQHQYNHHSQQGHHHKQHDHIMIFMINKFMIIMIIMINKVMIIMINIPRTRHPVQVVDSTAVVDFQLLAEERLNKAERAVHYKQRDHRFSPLIIAQFDNWD